MGNWFVIITACLSPLVGLYGLYCSKQLYRGVLERSSGNDTMRDIANLTAQGVAACLKAQYRLIVVFAVVVFFLLSGISALGVQTAVAFLIGVCCSTLASIAGCKSGTKANLRTAALALASRPGEAFLCAFHGSAVFGLCLASAGLIGGGFLFCILGLQALGGSTTPPQHLIGFAIGASLVTLLLRLTSSVPVRDSASASAEIGDQNIDADAPDLLEISRFAGDTVRDVAGMGADLFASSVAAMVAVASLAMSIPPEYVARLTSFAGSDEAAYRVALSGAPLALLAIGLLCSLVGMNALTSLKDRDPAVALRQSMFVAAGLFLVLALVYFIFSSLKIIVWSAAFSGVVAGILIGVFGEYYSTGSKIRALAEASRNGPMTNNNAGLSLGLSSVAPPVIVIAAAMLLAYWCADLYGIGICAVGMLSTVGIVTTVCAYHPIVDGAGRISNIAALGVRAEQTIERLKSSGYSVSASSEGFAVGASALVALALLSAYTQVVHGATALSLAEPRVIGGLLLGAALAAAVAGFSCRTLRHGPGRKTERKTSEKKASIEDRAAFLRQTARITTQRAVRGRLFPGLVVIIGAFVVAFLPFLGAPFLGGMLAGCLISGVVLAFFATNSGFETTVGPAMSGLIKLVAIVTLCVGPFLS